MCKERPILFNGPMVEAILSGRKTQTRRLLKPFQVPALNEIDGKQFWYSIVQNDRRYGFGVEGQTEQECIDQLITMASAACQFGNVGDRLWVRETWAPVNSYGAPAIAYRADAEIRELMKVRSFLDDDGAFNYEDPRVKPYNFSAWASDLLNGIEGQWKPSIHMPRFACRLMLNITNIRIERLNDISEADAQAEGVERVSVPDNIPVEDGYTKAIREMWKGYENKQRAYRDTAKDSFMSLWRDVYGAESWDANPYVWVIEFEAVSVRNK